MREKIEVLNDKRGDSNSGEVQVVRVECAPGNACRK
jgi:hypothetical protein